MAKTDDLRVAPAYSIVEAAHYLRMPEGTLRSWVVGRLYAVAGTTKRSRPLIHLDDPKKQYLSFINLVEAHVLAAIRRRHGVRLPKVRKALGYVQGQFPVDRPLIKQAFQTDGLDLFVERYGDLINASRERSSLALRPARAPSPARVRARLLGAHARPYRSDPDQDGAP